MNHSKLRRQIAFESACLMYQRQESEYFRAKKKAARRICRGWVKPADLPSNAEIRDEIQALARLYEGDNRTQNMREMRLEALRMMRVLHRFRPRLIGSVLTGHVPQRIGYRPACFLRQRGGSGADTRGRGRAL